MITLHFIYTLCYTYINLLLWHFTLHALYLYYITYVICNLVYKNDINLNKHILYYIFIFLFWKITFLDKKVRVFRKNCGFFFTIHCNPSLAYIAVRDLQSSQRNARVQLQLAGNFFVWRKVLARERWQTFENSWKKHNN